MRYGKVRLLIIFLVLLTSFIYFSLNIQAQNLQNQESIERAYEWLSEKVRGGWGNVEENAFAILALKTFNLTLAEEGVEELISKGTGECWPSGVEGCNIRDTALATIALFSMGRDISRPTEWLLNQRKLFLKGGEWFLQLELSGGGECRIEYKTAEERRDIVSVSEDRKIFLETASECFQILRGKDWWLNIKKDDGCLRASYYVSCNANQNNWVANILFVSNSVFVPFPSISSANWLQITSKCFGQNECDYDASAWASYALAIQNIDPETKAFLESKADLNAPISYALLYLITGNAEFASKLSDKQSVFGPWDGTKKFFRTAISHFSLLNSGFGDLDRAKQWLMDNQNPDYSWGSNKLRDTAAVLFGVFPSDREGIPGGIVPTKKPFDFNISVNPSTEIVNAGDLASYVIKVDLLSGSTQTIFLNISNQQEFGEVNFVPNSGEPPFSSVLTIKTSEQVVGNKTYNLRIIATNGSLTREAEVQLTVVGKQTGELQIQFCETQGLFCCPIQDVAEGADIIEELRCTDSNSVCVASSSDCVKEVTNTEEVCGLDVGVCCKEVEADATRYYELDDTCRVGEVCASSCKVYGKQESAKEQTCLDVGFCCETPASGAVRYEEFDSSCGVGEVCASECEISEVKVKKGNAFLKFLIWFLVILVIAGIVAAILLMRRRKQKESAGIILPTKRFPPEVPSRIPLFKTPSIPSTKLGVKPKTGLTLKGLPTLPRPISKPARPTQSIPSQPRAMPRAKVLIPKPLFKPAVTKPVSSVKKKSEIEKELEKTIKELEKIEKGGLKGKKKKGGK